MKKKLLLLGLGSILAISTVALSVVTFNKNKSGADFVDGGDVDYTLTVLSTDITTEPSSTSGWVNVVTDATKEAAPERQNKVKLNYENCSYHEDSGHEYVILTQYGVGTIANDVTSAIRSLKSVKYNGANNLIVEWGWYDEGTDSISYEDSAVMSGGETCYFGYQSPNYFRVSSTAYSVPWIESLVFTYDKSCSESSNPYFSKDGIRYYLYSDETAEVLGFSGASLATLDIPNIVAGHTVTSIGEEAFLSNSTITSLTLPSGLKYVYSRAFDGCNKIASINIPNTVRSIGFCAFRSTTSCTSLTFEAGGTQTLGIGQSAFELCGHSGKLTLPSRIDEMAPGSFAWMSGVTEFALNDDNVTGNRLSVIDGVLFCNYYGDFYLEAYPLADTRTSYTIPSNVQKVRRDAGLCGASNLVTLNIAPAEDTLIYFEAYSATSLINLENLNLGGAGTIYFYWYCLSGAPKLKDVVVPTNVICNAAGFGDVSVSSADPLKLHLVSSSIPGSWDGNWDGGDVAKGYITVDFDYVA